MFSPVVKYMRGISHLTHDALQLTTTMVGRMNTTIDDILLKISLPKIDRLHIDVDLIITSTHIADRHDDDDLMISETK